MIDTLGPVRLMPDNFTPPSRTPWGGRKIRTHYKAGLGLAPSEEVVGESWEISVEPSFPSRLAGGGPSLAEVIEGAPLAWLGASTLQRYGPQTPLLVKLLDTSANLSVQVHPEDGDPALKPGESGKPEAWVVLEAEPGAGLYLGFRDGVTRADVEGCLADQGPLDQLMNFVPVGSGDAFVIAAGTAHAIGAGLTLLEPQIVRPGARGLTYRFWDWNRRYDAAGKQDPGGEPRALHVERSLAVTDWDGPRGDAFVQSCRASTQNLGVEGWDRVLDWPWFRVDRWRGSGAFPGPQGGVMAHLTCTQGRLDLHGEWGIFTLRQGESAVVPAVAEVSGITGHEVEAFAAYCW